jgi:TolB-like protein/Flp pilus assembly protein TadD/predicted Ser/Thr protein kinase
MADQKISRYRLVRRLGGGGMGEVFLGEDTELERLVALKVMSVELAKDDNQRKRFRTEAKAASGLLHPNICVIHEVGETEDGRPFIAMEYVQGHTLDVILQQKRLRMREIITLGIEVAGALEAAHTKGIVHRDIKTANIMLDQRGHAKVLDFGLAKRFTADELSSNTTSVAQTRTGMLIGTPHYMSPEQALGHELDHRSDIFSLGAVLHELVSGQRPFLGRTVGETLNKVINQQPEPLGLANPVYTPALDNIIFKCLEKDRARRYDSAKDLGADLTKLKSEAELAIAQKESPAPVVAASPPKQEPAEVTASGNRSRERTWRAVAVGALAFMGIAGVAVLLHLKHGDQLELSGKKVATAQNSVAVLPFDNFSGEPDTDYLSDGLTEEITTALSRIPGLKVAARNSAFTFKGKKEDARRIGATLQVKTLLEGSIQKMGKRVHVNAQLINVADGYHLWSETYDRSVDDILALQADIASRIVERLQGVTNGMELHQAVNPEAHKLYMQARLFWNKRTQAGLKRAAELFQEALKKEPDYAAAHAGLAATYLLIPMYTVDARQETYVPLARASANRALELDPSCAEAHAVLGNLQAQPPARDLKGAEEHFRRAVELDHNYATAHHWYGRYMLWHGNRQNALIEFQNAVDLDPLSPSIRSTIPDWYYVTGDYDRALTEVQKVVEAFPEFPPVRNILILTLFNKGQYQEALPEIEKARALMPEEPLAGLEMRGFALARLGRTNEAQQIVSTLEEQRSKGRAVNGPIGFVYVGLRDYDKALEAFERMESMEGLDDEMFCDPLFKELRGLPRAQALLKKAGLAEEPQHSVSGSSDAPAQHRG